MSAGVRRSLHLSSSGALSGQSDCGNEGYSTPSRLYPALWEQGETALKITLHREMNWFPRETLLDQLSLIYILVLCPLTIMQKSF